MYAASMAQILVGIVLILVVQMDCRLGDHEEKSVWRLKRDVEERERQVTRAQRELAVARAKVALAQGQRQQAIDELRKAVAGYQGEVDWIRQHASWFCDPRELMTQARWDLAQARVRLAEIEGDSATLVAELKKIVGFHEERLKRVHQLVQMKVVKPEESKQVEDASIKARELLAAAEMQLAPKQRRQPGDAK